MFSVERLSVGSNMSSGTYTLFDIPTRTPRVCWSMNTWRSKSDWSNRYIGTQTEEARLLLNYKGLDYKTEWVSLSHVDWAMNANTGSLNIPISGRDLTSSK